MTDVEKVRTIIYDPVQVGNSEALGDGENKKFTVNNSPVYPDTSEVYLDGAIQSTGYTAEESLGLYEFDTAPTLAAIVSVHYRFTLLSDEQIEMFLELNEDNVRLAAADALDTIASSEALIQKRLKLLDLETDGPAVAKAMREHAKTLRAQVYDPKMAEGDFEIAELVYDIPSHTEKIFKDWLRELA